MLEITEHVVRQVQIVLGLQEPAYVESIWLLKLVHCCCIVSTESRKSPPSHGLVM
jgi:hypothetical protein